VPWNWFCCCLGTTQPQPVSVANATPGMMGLQPGNPTAVMGGAVPGMMGVPPGAPFNSGPVMGMQPGMMGVSNVYGMHPGIVGVPQQQMMMGMQAGMMGMPYQQHAIGIQHGMMHPGLMDNQQKTNVSFDEL